MRFRAAQLACLVFLLSSLGVAEGSALRSEALANICMAGLFQKAAAQQQDEQHTVAPACPRDAQRVAVLPAIAQQPLLPASTPVQQAAQVHTLTGLRR